MLRTNSGKLSFLKLLKPQTISADTVSTGMDLQQVNAATLLLEVGTFATFTSSNKLLALLEESDDNSTFNSVAIAEMSVSADSGAYTAPSVAGVVADLQSGTGDSVYRVQYMGNKRYIRINNDITGTVSIPVAVQGIGAHLESMPTL